MQTDYNSLFANSPVKIFESPQKGRGVISTRKINKGEVIWTDSPIVAISDSEFNYFDTRACSNCLKTLVDDMGAHELFIEPIECKICQTVFCSQQCKESDFHIVLCNNKLQEQHEKLRRLAVGIEPNYQILLLRFLAKVHAEIQRGKPLLEAWEPVGRLCTLPITDPMYQENESFHYKKNTELINEMIPNSQFEEFLTEQRFKQFIWTVRLNAFTIQPKNPVQMYLNTTETSSAYKYELTGAGLYPKTSFLNHSCKNNCVVVPNYLDSRHDVVTVEEIEEGEELTISYLTRADSVEEQHLMLKKKYLFDCKCE